MTKEIQVSAETPTQSISELKAGIQTIQQVMKSVMKEGEHYGLVPGCGDRKVLLKPGAEKIMATFRIAPSFDIVDLTTADECRYRVTAIGMYGPTFAFVGQGVGECSSNEEKYKWRAAVCDEEFDESPENRRRAKWKKGAYGKPAYQIKQIRTDHADMANTVLKMAVKRALVAMVLTVTAASDIFAQDLEDAVPDVGRDQAETQAASEEKFYCVECKSEITKQVNDYSVKTFKKPLCFAHQKTAKNG